jgi:hypothetical protein
VSVGADIVNRWDLNDGAAWLAVVTAAGKVDTPESWALVIVQVQEVRARVGPGTCRVYWGSHGCFFAQEHTGPCMCDCAVPMPGESDQDCDCRPGCMGAHGCAYCVGAAPHYGSDTTYYGEDVEGRGLPTQARKATP